MSTHVLLEETDIIFVGRCDQSLLFIAKSGRSVGKIKIVRYAGSALVASFVQVYRSLVEDAVFRRQSSSLVTLHGDFSLVLSKARLDPGRCDVQRIKVVRLTPGFRLSKQYFVGHRILLFRDRSINGIGSSFGQTALALVDTRTGDSSLVDVPVSSVRRISSALGLVLVQKRTANGFRVFTVDID